ncbi:hypothetical protein E8D37_14795 [Nocardioides sp. GY 10127]|nr:hypothetical protein E8D37_14795 [Nocardioides sp. GY 10127]
MVHTVLQVGPDPAAAAVVADWCAVLAAAPPVRVLPHVCADAEEALRALAADLQDARVGHRVLVAGSARDCLAVRAAALRAGLTEEELTVGVTSVAVRDVWCVHCAATASAEVDLEGVVACPGCSRSLLVYPHVSRRSGAHLGFQVDAEQLPEPSGAAR